MKRLFVLLGVLIFTGCIRGLFGYDDTVKDGIKTLPEVAQMKALFPNSIQANFITQYGFDTKIPVVWSSEVFFGGRYRLVFQVYVEVDYSKHRIVKMTSQPKFGLLEFKEVFYDTTGNVGADFSNDYKFGEKEWEKLVKANGDFSVIGIKVMTNSPLPLFDEGIRAEREGRREIDQ